MRGMLFGFFVLIGVTVGAQATTYNRGDMVRLQPQSSPAVLRVVAVSGDRVRIDDTGVYVNEAAVTGFSADFIAHVKPWESQLVPTGHYFSLGTSA